MNRKTNEGKKMGNRSDNDGIQWFHSFFLLCRSIKALFDLDDT